MRDDLGAFAQRAKADDYPTHTFLVLFGATHDADSLVEVHVVVSEKWLVTVHTESCPAFVSLRKRTMRGGPLPSTAMLAQRIADSLADSFYPSSSNSTSASMRSSASSCAASVRMSCPRC